MSSVATVQPARRTPKRVLPGFKLTLGYAIFCLSLIVLIPLSALVFKTFTLSREQFWAAVASPRVVASYQLTFGASLIAALVNAIFGLPFVVRTVQPVLQDADDLGNHTADHHRQTGTVRLRWRPWCGVPAAGRFSGT